VFKVSFVLKSKNCFAKNFFKNVGFAKQVVE